MFFFYFYLTPEQQQVCALDFDYIKRRLALDISRQLRDRNKTFTELTDLYGFSSPSYFSRYVQKYLGVSPSELRE